MKQSTIILLLGVVYAIIALMLKGESTALCLVYASLAGLTAIMHVILCEAEK